MFSVLNYKNKNAFDMVVPLCGRQSLDSKQVKFF